VGHALRSSVLLRVEASLARVFQSGLKTGGGVTTGGVRDIIVEVISKSSGKPDGSMRWDTSDPATVAMSCSFY
jgi:hypothetical protein